MRPDDMASLAAVITRVSALLALDTGERIFAIDEERALRQSRAEASAKAPTSIAIIPMFGALRPRGASGMEGSRARIAAAADNPDIGALVLDIDSPGGTYAGTPETAATVRAATGKKPVIALVDSLAASAAYWIASQASSIVVSPSAEVGSIGVLALHLEISKALEDFGVKPTILRSVPNKAEGNMFEPLSEDAKAYIQTSVDQAHDEFIRAVAAGRNTTQARVAEEFGKGRTIDARRAVALGMADKIGTMSDVLAGLRTRSGTIRRRSAFAF